MTAAVSNLAARVGAALAATGATVTTAESCTGGGIAEAITRISGSSAWFERGWVVYSNAAKIKELGVSAEQFKADGAVSEAVVCAMAVGARARANATWAIAVSGVAGPDGGTEHKPVGTVWLAWAGPQGVQAERHFFSGSRDTVRQRAVLCALNILLDKISVASC